ncbi:hypothetical protein BVIET440_130110 [Burkholderia vietnamiensis]
MICNHQVAGSSPAAGTISDKGLRDVCVAPSRFQYLSASSIRVGAVFVLGYAAVLGGSAKVCIPLATEFAERAAPIKRLLQIHKRSERWLVSDRAV